MCRGAIAEAIALYDKGLELATKGSDFEIYLMLLKCTSLMAANERAALEAACAAVYTAKPILRAQIGLMFAAPNKPLAPDLRTLLATLDQHQAPQHLLYLRNVSARHFHAPAHRRNVMRGLIAHLVRRFGPAIIPPGLAEFRPLGDRTSPPERQARRAAR